MKAKFALIVWILLLIILNKNSYGQYTVTDNRTASQLANKLLGSGVTLINPVLDCEGIANGIFGGSGDLGIDSGIVLTTGRSATTPGGDGVNGEFIVWGNPSEAHFNPGDAQLDGILAGISTYDACILEFDFVPQGDSISFNFIFGSSEYGSYSCSNYNDVFGFFISGNEYATPYNMAIIPGTTIPICVNSTTGVPLFPGSLCTSLGAGSPFEEYYVDNTAGLYISYGGFTQTFQATAAVTACDTYHLKLAIADGEDYSLDSGVFLEANSLNSAVDAISTSAGLDLDYGEDDFTVRGCPPASFTIVRSGSIGTGVTMPISFSGTAVADVDYTSPGTSIYFPPGVTTVTVPISALIVPTVTGPRSVIINVSTTTGCGANSSSMQDTIMIYDSLLTTLSISDTLVCPGETVIASVSMDTSLSVSWTPAGGVASLDSLYSIVITDTTIITGTVTYGTTSCPPSTVTKIVHTYPIETDTVNATICTGGSYSFGGSTYTSAVTGVLYTTTSVVTGCDSNAILNLAVVAPATATISYPGTPFCKSEPNPSPTITGTTGGTFSGSTGLVINATTGVINLATSTAGTHTVTYTIAATAGCPAFTTTATVVIATAPSATISYAGTPYCSNEANPSPTITGTTGGSFSGSAGLVINATTGIINLATSTAGTHTVTYTIAATAACPAYTTTATVVIATAPSATISYAGTPYCSNEANPSPTITGTTGGSFSGSAGLVINATTGVINLVTSTAGTHTVTYTIAATAACPAYTTTATVVIATAPSATISYAGTPYCSNEANPSPTITGTTGGSFSGSTGLVINATTGVINLATSTSGTHTVTYTIAATAACPAYTTTATVVIATAPSATISYAGTPYCSNEANPSPTVTGTSGGTFSGSAGLVINATTGVINLATSTAGTHTVTYTIAATAACPAFTTTTSVVIATAPSATISYAGTPYCSNEANPSPSITGTTGGTFSGSTGLVINATTGVINLATSTAGTHTVTYTIAATAACPAYTTTTSVVIATAPSATISYAGTPYCSNEANPSPTITGTTGGSFSGSAGLVINATTGVINLVTSTAGTHTVTYTIAATAACPANTTTATVVIATAPSATISYAGTPYCSNEANPSPTITGTTGGSFSGSTGLVINATTGVINLAPSTAGTHTVTYTIAATAACPAFTTTSTVVIATAPSATISYAGTPYCSNEANPSPSITGTTGGTFSGSAGLVINATTGVINLAPSTAGTHTVTYTIAATAACPAFTTTATIVINPIATSIQNISFCSGQVITINGIDYSNTTMGVLDTFVNSVGCDSIITYNLTETDTIFTTASASICYGGSVIIGGTLYDAAGTYPIYAPTAAGCDSMHTLTITVNPILTDTITETICSGTSYTFGSATYSSAGTYTYTETSGPCDTLKVLVLTETDTIFTTAIASICYGGSVTFGGTLYDEAGTYPIYAPTAAGCDSMHTLTITVNPILTDTITETICSGTSYTFGSATYSSAGTYTYTETSGPCDTLKVLVLTETDTIFTTASASICYGGSVTIGGTLYDAAGTYPIYAPTAAGCDSMHTLTITVNPILTDTITETICSGTSYTFGSATYSSAGTYTYTETSGPCDTLKVLVLTETDTIFTTASASICYGGSVIIGGTLYDAAGTYPIYAPTAAGCDSMHTLTITVNPILTDTITETICSGTSYTFGSATYSSAGTYTYTETSGPCDTLKVLVLTETDTIFTTASASICYGGSVTIGGTLYDAAGTYPIFAPTAAGCDSMHTLTITVNPILTDTITETICSGTSYTFGSATYSSAGTYTYTENGGPCDTLKVLELTVTDTIFATSTDSICAGGSITLGSMVITTAGVYSLFAPTAAGCDSVHTLTVIVNPVITDTIVASICNGTTYSFYGNDYTATGIYSHASLGVCDTTHILQLTVHPTYANIQDLVVCRNELPMVYLGVTIPLTSMSDSTFTTISFTSINGCDSSVTINLVIHDTSRTDIDTTLCYGTIWDWGGTTITGPGIYTQLFTNVSNCDSTVIIEVEYTPAPVSIDTTIRACGSTVYNSTTYTVDTFFIDTFYNVLSCDSLYSNVSIDILNEPKDTIQVYLCQGEQYDFNGTIYTNAILVTQTYTADNGCDSTITLDLRYHPPVYASLTMATFTEEELCVYDTVTLMAGGAQTYSFYDGFGRLIPSNTNSAVVMLPRDQNTFFVVGVDINSCVDTAWLNIDASACCEMVMPNAFSPNGDGLNDAFGPVTFGNPQNYRFEIFDRWGTRVFHSFKVQDKWDGTHSGGKQADLGDYFYIVTGICYDGTPFKYQGDVSLVR